MVNTYTEKYAKIYGINHASNIQSNGSNGGSGNNGSTLPPIPSWTGHITSALDLFSSFAGAIETSIWAARNLAFIDFHYAAYGISRYNSLEALKSPLGKTASFISFGLIVADVGLDIYNSVQQGYSFGKGLTSAGLTLGKDLGVMYVSSKVGGLAGAFVAAKLGASIGSWAGPVGLVAGTAIGFGVGYVVNEFGDIIIDEILSWFD